MNVAEELQAANYPIRIPLGTDERDSFASFLEVRGAKIGPFLRQMILTVMDPSSGPIIEAAMRGRPLVDTSSGQAKELQEALEATR
jgi:hypothetical protein